MPNLSDFFPDDIRDEFAENNLTPGSILRFYVTDTTPPKQKLIIVLAKEATNILLATVFINSEINPNIFHSEELRQLHFLLKAAQYDFLKHDSFADCSKIREREIHRITALLKESPSVHTGKLNEDDFRQIKRIIKNARTIPISTKRKFGLLN